MNADTSTFAATDETTGPVEPMPTGRSACVIGSGFGGLALAIRLQSAGIQTTVVEARDKPGGRAYYWEREGFTFDAGPTVITDPNCLKELWALSGHDIAEDVELMPVMPFYRLAWPDGTQFDYSNDEEELFREIAQLNPADVAGYQRFLEYSEAVYEEATSSSAMCRSSISNRCSRWHGARQAAGLAQRLFDGLELCRERETA